MQLAEITTKLISVRQGHDELMSELYNIKFHDFWQNHYSFNNQSKKKHLGISAELKNKIIINVIHPWTYMKNEISSTQKSKSEMMQRLNELHPEKNQIISNWAKIGVKAKTAYDSQALIELKNESCNQKKCLFCTIGKSLLYK